MEAWDTIGARRNVRTYLPDLVPGSDLDRIAVANAVLGVSDDHIVSYLLGIGYPADRSPKPTREPVRRPIAEVVHRGRW